MEKDWLSTGDVAALLGVSRQHIVNLCDRGELAHVKCGTHRRIRHADALRMMRPSITREQEKSLWLHRAILGSLMTEPHRILQAASENIARWKPLHRPDGMTVQYLDQWQCIIDDGVDTVAAVLTGLDAHSCELRQNSPFAGILTEDQRRQVLHSFREHWEHGHRSARGVA